MPKLSETVLIKAAKSMGLQGQAKILALTDDQWDELEERCARELGLPTDWKERTYNDSVNSLRAKDHASNYQPFKIYYKDRVHKEEIKAKPKKELEEDDNLTLF